MITLTTSQERLVRLPLDAKIFLEGPASCGKSTAGVARLATMLEEGVPGNSILVLAPQRNIHTPFIDLLSSPQRQAGGEFTPVTLGGLARRMCDLFWPLAAQAAGFSAPGSHPTFLTLETSQYFMARLLRQLIKEKGLFDSLTINRNRLYSQILDNLNKSAAVGFPHTQISERLDAAWSGDSTQRRIYADAQECATLFRRFCLEHNLLDFSLQLEIFLDHLWPQPLVHNYILDNFHHLIYDNIEEDFPRAHDFIADLLPYLSSALLIYDSSGGYRRFLGADLESAGALQEKCTHHIYFADSFIVPPNIAHLSQALAAAIDPSLEQEVAQLQPVPGEDIRTPAFSLLFSRYYPDLLDQVVAEILKIIQHSQVQPGQIAVLFPYLSDAIRFSLMTRLEAAGIPVRSHRPSRSLHDEPASQCLFTLSALAHPCWEINPTPFEVAYAFMLALDMDLVRARLLTDAIYKPKNMHLESFDLIKATTQERVTYTIGSRYSILSGWLLAYRARPPEPVDHFLRSLFGEVLSQPGFGFHQIPDHARVAASLVESAQKFRQVLQPAIHSETNPDQISEDLEIGREFFLMLADGVIAAQYLEAWQDQDGSAVLVAPAHTFLMMNTPAAVQFWLDAGSSGWTERLSQPLTHPFVLSRQWDRHPGSLWTDADEVRYANDSLARLVTGLLRRCSSHIYLGIADLGETGFEQRGGLLRAFQQVLQKEARS